jgi:hypothetical protein
VQIIITELGLNAEPVLIEMMAAIAAQERRMISRRTKAALAAGPLCQRNPACSRPSQPDARMIPPRIISLANAAPSQSLAPGPSAGRRIRPGGRHQHGFLLARELALCSGARLFAQRLL